jgi:EAL domain-containing protein (putative c-di-GMP-specific phosphodiesterase class I)
MENGPKDVALTANLISLAHTLGVPAIAEGIETEGQLESVRSVGCDLAQGFLFARPMPAQEITKLLAAACPPATATPISRPGAPAGAALR